jgi:hypothetical protein
MGEKEKPQKPMEASTCLLVMMSVKVYENLSGKGQGEDTTSLRKFGHFL